MKTWQASLAQIGITALMASVGRYMASPNIASHEGMPPSLELNHRGN